MEKNTTSKLVKGAFILALAGLIGKVLGASYRIPLKNMLGDIGFYIYQQVYPILGLALMLALYGFPSAVAKLGADLKQADSKLGLRNFYLPAWLIMVLFCGMLALGLFASADLLALQVGDQRLAPIYKMACLVFLTIPFTALLRGAYQAQDEMVPVALSQLIEQFFRVLFIIWAAVSIADGAHNTYWIGHAAVLAALLGAVCAFILLLACYKKIMHSEKENVTFPWKQYVRCLVGVGLVATLNHALLLIIQMADAFTVLPGLQAHGYTVSEAMVQKGIFDRGQPLIQIGSVLGSSLALSVLPAISLQKLREAPAIFEPYMRIALKMSVTIGAGATLGLAVIFPETNNLLFQDTAGTSALRLLVTAILCASLAMTMAAMLQGFGFIKRTAWYILAAFAFKGLLNLVLVPIWGITGGAAATVGSLLLMLLLVYKDLKQIVPQLFAMNQSLWKALAIAAGGMLLFLAGAKTILFSLHITSRVLLLPAVFVLVAGGGFIYVFLLFRNHAFSDDEIEMMPFGRLLSRFKQAK